MPQVKVSFDGSTHAQSMVMRVLVAPPLAALSAEVSKGRTPESEELSLKPNHGVVTPVAAGADAAGTRHARASRVRRRNRCVADIAHPSASAHLFRAGLTQRSPQERLSQFVGSSRQVFCTRPTV